MKGECGLIKRGFCVLDVEKRSASTTACMTSATNETHCITV